MRRHHLSLTLLALLLSAGPTNATDEDRKSVHLICTYSYTIDDKGEKSGTSGEDLFTVLPLKAGQVTIRKQGLAVPFLGKMSEDEIVGEANYTVSNIRLTESLAINRFTGGFQLSFGAPGKRGLIHFGSCRVTTKQLF